MRVYSQRNGLKLTDGLVRQMAHGILVVAVKPGAIIPIAYIKSCLDQMLIDAKIISAF